jgi:hypothetical protein
MVVLLDRLWQAPDFDFDLVLSAPRLGLLGQRRGQRSALLYLRVPERKAFLTSAA